MDRKKKSVKKVLRKTEMKKSKGGSTVSALVFSDHKTKPERVLHDDWEAPVAKR